MHDVTEAESLIFEGYNRVGAKLRGYDQHTRDLTPARELYARAGLSLDFAPAATVTGSKGKGSTAIFTAALLAGAGERVGLLTSPGYISNRERIRFEGVAIPEADYLAIVEELAPQVRAITAELPPDRYLSPTAIFLAIGLRWWQAQGATALVLEVGRGGRFDEVSLYRNRVAVFTPIMGEHLDRLGPTLADIAWHKAGIIRPGCAVISAPQDAAISVQLSAISHQSSVISYQQLGPDDLRAAYPEPQSPARYLRDNLALAGAAASALIGRELSPEAGVLIPRLLLPGRCDRIAGPPALWVDGAINAQSARLFRLSVADQITRPLVLITALPDDKDAPGLLAELGPLADHLILTRAGAGYVHYSDATAQAARTLTAPVDSIDAPEEAFARGLALAGQAGTLWVVGTQSLVAAAMRRWRTDLEHLW